MPPTKKSAATKVLKSKAAPARSARSVHAADYRHKDEALSRPDVGTQPQFLVDTNYNGLSFHVCRAFFPRTQAWDSAETRPKAEYEDAVWQHLAGNVSVAFEPGEHAQIAVKVIDDRGNELMVVKSLKEVV